MADLKNLKVLNWGGVDYNVGWSENDFTSALKAKLEGIAEGAQVNVIETIKLNGSAVAVSEKAVDLGNLQKALTAGAGIAIAEDGTISTTLDVEAFKVVTELPDAPAAGNESKIHVVPNAAGVEGDVYNEYLWDGSKWELLGSFKADVDLSDYAKTADVESAIAGAKAELQAEIDKKVAQADYDAKVSEIEGNIAKKVDTATYEAYVAANDAAVSANTTKLAGITAGANKVSSSYDESSATLTVTVE